MTEFWLPVPGYDGLYEVSDQGQVRSLPRNTTRGKILKPIIDRYGYPWVTLTKDGKQRRDQIHRLVLSAFTGPCPDRMECRHLDGNPGNGTLTNLAWGTRSENMQDVVRHGNNVNANKTHCPRGHEYTPDNTKLNALGGRVCATCKRELGRINQRNYRARRAGNAQ